MIDTLPMRVLVVLGVLACSGPTGGGDAGGTDSAGVDAPLADASPDAGVDGGSACTESATVNGMLLGATMNARDAFSFQGDPASGNWFFVITDYAGACAHAEANQSVASSRTMFFGYTQAPAPGIGASAIGSSTPWYIQLNQFDATCTGTDDVAISGTVTLTSITPSCVSATFDLVFGGAGGTSTEHVTGNVTAPACTPPTDAGAPTCH
jgi:hypothetical protein